MVNRYPVKKIVDSKILNEKIIFPTSKKVAKNRILKTALSEYCAKFTPDVPSTHGCPTQIHVNMYEKWSKGGFGMITTGHVMIDHSHLEAPGNTIIEKDYDSLEKRQIWTQIANVIKKNGSLAIVQLGHAGRQTQKIINPKPFSSSTVPLTKEVFNGRIFGQPIELNEKQIKNEVIKKFAFAAKFFYDCGFDGIQIQAGHGYLLSQFLSRTTNKRNDNYGGKMENRAKIVVEIYEKIRNKIPIETGFIIGAKMNSFETQNDGLTVDEAKEFAQILDKIGFDYIELSGGTYETSLDKPIEKSTSKYEAYFADSASEIKPLLKNAKLFVTGGFRIVDGMVTVVDDGIVDGIGIGRPACHEFDLASKILNKEIQSTIQYPFENDPGASSLSCSLQMYQAGLRSYDDGKNINEDIMDLSDEKIAKEYYAEQQKYLEKVLEATKVGQIIFGCVPYKIHRKKETKIDNPDFEPHY